MRRPPVVLGMATITILALLVAVGLILFSVNPIQRSNQDEIEKAVTSQHAIICAQVQNTANAYRFRSLTPSGEVEPIRHFLTRMQAQAQTLRLARGAECKSAPGFPPVGLQVKRALHQIQEILMHFEPRLREPISNGASNLSPRGSDRQKSFLPRFEKPSKAGVDESGVPAQLRHELAPEAPLSPSVGHQAKRGAKESPEAESAAEEPTIPRGQLQGEDNPQDVHVRAEPPAPEGLPEITVPLEIEASEEDLKITIGGPEE